MKARRTTMNVVAVITAMITPALISLIVLLGARDEENPELREIAALFTGFFLTCIVLTICLVITVSHVRSNPHLSKSQKQAWSAGMFALPFSILAYWWLHARRENEPSSHVSAAETDA